MAEKQSSYMPASGNLSSSLFSQMAGYGDPAIAGCSNIGCLGERIPNTNIRCLSWGLLWPEGGVYLVGVLDG